MNALLVAFALSTQPAPPPTWLETWLLTGNVYRSESMHVGIRPAWDGGHAFGITVQVKGDWERGYARY